MDWSKAKNTLIIAFLITDILLLAVFFVQKQKESKQLELSTESTISYLEQKNINVNCVIPVKTKKMPVLGISFESSDKSEKSYRTSYKNIPLEIIGIYDGSSLINIKASKVKIEVRPAYMALLDAAKDVTGDIDNIELVYLVDRIDFSGEAGTDTALLYWKITSSGRDWYYSAFQE